MFVVHGHEPVLPNILLNPRATHTNKLLTEFVSSHANTIQQAHDSLTSAHDAMPAHVNRSHRDVTIKTGDLVMISANMLTTDFERNRTSDKLSDCWLGPFKILQALSLVIYRS
ncbi:hypothetical protein GGI14_005948 [Coemansia sp. S680]|nr:hypothetical protein GGI14_005948 [Coemansia sp. S680]